MIAWGSLLVYVTPKGRRYLKKLAENEDWHSNDGIVRANEVHELDFGSIVKTHTGVPIFLQEATLEDRLMGAKRQTQIIYAKDLAYIALKLGAGPGRTIIEAGCGSGGLTMALSWFAGPTGRVVSHDAREEFIKLARRNLDWAGLGQNVELHLKDISSGFATNMADA
ncbi:MAG: methyltransferase domain-containing protein, partial [Desulfovibrio sp.]|nr:methyltransferase domain-containing protein [Desulfovibrio sp.]